MFQEILQEVIDQTDGALAGVVMGFDGITVDSLVADAADLNVETVGMEYSVVLTQIKQAAEMLALGTTSEVTVQAQNMTTVIRLLNNEYFIALAIRPTGNLGKARYMLRLRAPKLLEGLS